MPNPTLPGVPESEQALLYAKLNEYNRGRASFKEAGVYMVVVPRFGKPNYSLWLYTPMQERQIILFIHELSPDIHQSLRMASTQFYYSRRCIVLVEYNEKRMQSNGDDLVFFGKYRGHFLHDVLAIDPSYLSWIAYSFTPRIPKQERFVKIAQAYHSVYLDCMLRKAKEKPTESQYLGEEGEKLKELKLKVLKIKLEDDPYRTKIFGTTPRYYVRQRLTLADPIGNLVTMSLPAHHYSAESCTLSGLEHAYQPGDILYIASAIIARRFEYHGSKYTRLNRVRLMDLNASSSRL